MERLDFDNKCWNYYLFLEDNFINTTRYVYLSEDNFECYSFEFNSLLLSFCSELENTIKIAYMLIKNIKPNKRECIYYIFEQIKDTIFYPLSDGKLPEAKIISVPNIKLCPFRYFLSKPIQAESEKKVKDKDTWWKSYNNIKHNRQDNIKAANLENTLNALASLYLMDSLLIMYYARQGHGLDAPDKPSRLFYPDNLPIKTNWGPICTVIDNIG